jgi:hypothetical protein
MPVDTIADRAQHRHRLDRTRAGDHVFALQMRRQGRLLVGAEGRK